MRLPPRLWSRVAPSLLALLYLVFSAVFLHNLLDPPHTALPLLPRPYPVCGDARFLTRQTTAILAFHAAASYFAEALRALGSPRAASLDSALEAGEGIVFALGTVVTGGYYALVHPSPLVQHLLRIDRKRFLRFHFDHVATGVYAVLDAAVRYSRADAVAGAGIRALRRDVAVVVVYAAWYQAFTTACAARNAWMWQYPFMQELDWKGHFVLIAVIVGACLALVGVLQGVHWVAWGVARRRRRRRGLPVAEGAAVGGQGARSKVE